MSMTTKHDGGPAFPTGEVYDNGGGGIREYMREGMSLRDYFAAHAPMPSDHEIQLLQTRDRNQNPHNDHYLPKLRSRVEIEAALRFEWADAMLAARAAP